MSRNGRLDAELQITITLIGTINIAPDRFLDNAEELFDHPDEISIEVDSIQHGYTYRVEIVDVRCAEMRPDGTFKVTFQKPGCDARKTSTEHVPRGFSVTNIETHI